AVDEAPWHQHVNANLARALVKVDSNSIPMWFRGRTMGAMQLRRKPPGKRSVRTLSTYGGDVRLSPGGVRRGGAVGRSSGFRIMRRRENYVKRLPNFMVATSEAVTFSTVSREAVRVERDEGRVPYISNTD